MTTSGLCRLLAWGILIQIVGGVKIPDRSCTTQSDCASSPWTTPSPFCEDGECQCPNGTCFIHTTNGATYNFYCGECGVLGSTCNETMKCNQMNCWRDNFCHCDQGNVYRELCVLYTPIPTTLSSVILIVVLVIMLIILRLIKSWERIRNCCSRCCRGGCCSDRSSELSTVVGINPKSGEKSAAYTITNSAFMVTSRDSDLEWALEFSRQMLNRREDWISMGSLTWSSSSSARNSYGRQRFQSQLEAIAEPGPSGLSRMDSGDSRRPNISSSVASFSTRHRSSTLSSASSSSHAPISSGRSSLASRSRSSRQSSLSSDRNRRIRRGASVAPSTSSTPSSTSSRCRSSSSSTQFSRSSRGSVRSMQESSASSCSFSSTNSSSFSDRALRTARAFDWSSFQNMHGRTSPPSSGVPTQVLTQVSRADGEIYNQSDSSEISIAAISSENEISC